MLEENEDDSDQEPYDSYDLSDTATYKLLSPSSTRASEDEQIGPKEEVSKMGSRKHSPTIFSPIASPPVPSPRVLYPIVNEKKSESRTLRLLSSRGEQRVATSALGSPATRSDYSSNSVESDGEVSVCLAPLAFLTLLFDVFLFFVPFFLLCTTALGKASFNCNCSLFFT